MKKIILFFNNLFKKPTQVETPVVTVTVTVTAQPKPTPTPKPVLVVASANDDVSNFLLTNGFVFVSQNLMEMELPNNALIRYDLKTTDLVKTMQDSKISLKVSGDVLKAQKFLRKHGK